MQVYSNKKHIICYCIIQIRKMKRCIYEINIFFRVCSSATVATAISATNKTMILESLTNSYLDFL